MNDWGEIKLHKIEIGDDFWSIFDEIVDDDSSFINSRNKIVESYKEGIMYSLIVEETESMYKRYAIDDPFFCKNSIYMIPCFCIAENNIAYFIWTHKRARRMGFASTLVKMLDVKHADYPLPGSEEFWESCGIII